MGSVISSPDTSPLSTLHRNMSLPIVWIIGGPGSGKGTQCDNIVAKFGYSHLSSGDLLRDQVLSGSEKGKQLFSVMSQGALVPDEEVIELIKMAMEAKSDSKGFIIDGFPVSSAQAKLFEEKIGSPSKILYLSVNDIILKERLIKRSNFDDQPEAIDKRIETFNIQTKAVAKEYASLVSTINGERSATEIFEDIKKFL